MAHKIVFYKELTGRIPAMDWIEKLPNKVRHKFYDLFLMLELKGNKLGRKQLAYLGNKIYELRIVHTGNHYRLLCFFDGTKIVVMSNGFMKKTKKVPQKELTLVLKRKKEYLKDRYNHSL